MLNWNKLSEVNQLDALVEESMQMPVVIFKHSTRCSISSAALGRMQRGWTNEHDKAKAYYLDLIAYRDVSHAIAQRFGVEHQSPQVIVLRKGEAIYDTSHNMISAEDLLPLFN
jgi:bacillithiol system protein YtxJ